MCVSGMENIKGKERQPGVVGKPGDQDAWLSIFDERLYGGPRVHIDKSEV